MEVLRKYATQTEIYFPLITFGATDFASTIIGGFAAGDVKITRDGTTNFAAANLPFQAGGDLTSKSWGMTVQAGELTGKKIQISVVDQSGTKIWADQMIEVITYGNAAAELPFTFGDVETKVDAISVETAKLTPLCVTVDAIKIETAGISSNAVAIKAKTDLLMEVVQAETVTTDKIFADRTFDDDEPITLSGGPVNLYIRGGRGFLYIDNQVDGMSGNANIIIDGFEGSVVIYGNVSYNVTTLTVRGLKGVLQLNHEIVNAYLYGCFGYLFGGAVSNQLTIKGGGGHNEITAAAQSVDGFIEGATLDTVAVDVAEIKINVGGISNQAIAIKADTTSILADGAKEATLAAIGADVDAVAIDVAEIKINVAGISSQAIAIKQDTNSIINLGAKEATLVSVGADVDAVQVTVDDIEVKVDAISAQAIAIKQDTESILSVGAKEATLVSLDEAIENVIIPNYFVTKTGSSGNDGKTWATAKATIAQGIALLTGDQGVLNVGEGTWAEEFTLPAYKKLIGYGECLIWGPSSGSAGPTATLSEGSILERVQLGKRNADAGAKYIVRMERDSVLRNIQHRYSAFPELALLAFAYVPYGQVTIEDCFISGNAGDPTPITCVTGQLRSSHLRRNFFQTPADVITIEGTTSGNEDMIDISNNAFRSGAGSYCVKFIGTVGGANPGRVALINNRWSGADGFRLGGNNVLEVDNIKISEDTQAIHDLVWQLPYATNTVLSTEHGSGFWDAVSSGVTVLAIGVEACQSIDNTIAPRFATLQANMDDNLNKEVTERTPAGNPKRYKVGTAGNQKAVLATYEPISGIEKAKIEEIE